MKDSKIEWCDHTFNPWEGCTEVSPACLNCYAAARNARYNGGTAINWGKGAPRRRTSEKNWHYPLQWDREAAATGIRLRVFCASLADWLDDAVPIEWLADLLDLIRRTPHLDWLLLTKRPQNWQNRLDQLRCERLPTPEHGAVCRELVIPWLNNSAPDNVWIGTTVEDQVRANQRIPHLLRIPAKVRFLSCEPLLGALDICFAFHRSTVDKVCPRCLFATNRPSETDCPNDQTPLGPDVAVDWVICGGESGPFARPSNPAWFRSLRDQCSNAGAAFFFKQWGEWIGGRLDRRKGKMMCQATATGDDGRIFWTNPGAPMVHEWDPPEQYWTDASAWFGKRRAGRVLDGVKHNAFPEA